MVKESDTPVFYTYNLESEKSIEVTNGITKGIRVDLSYSVDKKAKFDYVNYDSKDNINDLGTSNKTTITISSGDKSKLREKLKLKYIF